MTARRPASGPASRPTPRSAISRRAADARAADTTTEPTTEPGGWTAEQDGRILASGGRYARLARLAEGWGLPARAVLLRWHRLRAAR